VKTVGEIHSSNFPTFIKILILWEYPLYMYYAQLLLGFGGLRNGWRFCYRVFLLKRKLQPQFIELYRIITPYDGKEIIDMKW
jgi:hypothetical protein